MLIRKQNVNSVKQNVNSETQALDNTLNQKDLIDIIRTFHSNAEDILFSSARGAFSRVDNILGHKSNLRKLK